MVEKSPELSIIVPVYKVEKYISRCIESVLSQTIDNWELILVDDASPDKSGQICDYYAKKDRRLVVIHKKVNDGAFKARKSGIDISRGKYIAFVDADDWIESCMYERLIELLKKSGADIAEGSYFINYDHRELIHNDGGNICEYSKDEAIEQLHIGDSIQEFLCTKVYRRTCIPNYNEEKKIIVGEDYSLLVHIFEECYKIVYLAEPFYHYFQRKESVCNAGYTDAHKDVVNNYRYYREYLCKKYPLITATVTARTLYNEMAVLVAMTKNSCYDKEVIKMVTSDVRHNILKLKRAKGRCLKMRVSTLLVTINPYILLGIYWVYNKLWSFRIQNRVVSHECNDTIKL